MIRSPDYQTPLSDGYAMLYLPQGRCASQLRPVDAQDLLDWLELIRRQLHRAIEVVGYDPIHLGC
jgi:hypothetical protein